jgi:hypothetical protein
MVCVGVPRGDPMNIEIFPDGFPLPLGRQRPALIMLYIS